MKKLALILPYFGKFKNYFQLFLDSVGKNSDIDLLLYTDNKENYSYPKNVKKIEISFEEFKNKIQDKFDFEISLDKPYKLCDFKPAYGYLLEEEIKDYLYWGHCDCDLVFGNLSKFIDEPILKGFDKIFSAGHLTLYKNDYENNRVFTSEYKDYGAVYKKALSTPMLYAFDEMNYAVNVDAIFKCLGKKVYTYDCAYNVETEYYNFLRKRLEDNSLNWVTDKKLRAIYYNDGKILACERVGDKIEVKEFAYIHLQMRCIPKIEKGKVLRFTPKGIIAEEFPATLKQWKKTKKKFGSIEGIKKFLKRIKYFNKKSLQPKDIDLFKN